MAYDPEHSVVTTNQVRFARPQNFKSERYFPFSFIKNRSLDDIECASVIIIQVRVPAIIQVNDSGVFTGFKAFVWYFLSNFYFSPNDSPLKTMRTVFYFIFNPFQPDHFLKCLKISYLSS